MEQILPSYNDPLFSIILIILMVLIISIVTYGWSMYQEQKEQKGLLKFLENFDSLECSIDINSMPFEEHTLKPLTLLAKAFENSGEYHKAIKIYIYLIKHSTGSIKFELMEALGNTYLYAGFLERAKKIYLEILRKKPRSILVLYSLGLVYEQMQEYIKAKETLIPLNELGEEVFKLEKLMLFLELQKEQNIKKLKELLKSEPLLYRYIIIFLFEKEYKEAWSILDIDNIEEILDILWFLPSSKVDFNIVSSSKKLTQLYYAKGYLENSNENCDIFTIDMLAILKKANFNKADLEFSYLCKKCKSSFPISFRRCPKCRAIYTIGVEEKIIQKREVDYSLF